MKRFTLRIMIFLFFGAAVNAQFRLTVTSDPHDSTDTWKHTLSEMNRICGDEGVFHITCGNEDPPQDRYDDLKRVCGDDVIWYPCVGDHSRKYMDWHNHFYSNYSRLAYMQNAKPGPTHCAKTTFSFDYGNAHFIQLNEFYNGNSDFGTDGDVVDSLYDWLAKDLNTNTKPAILVWGHEPAYPIGGHIGSSLDKYTENRDRFWQLLEDHKVVAYITGHTHRYSRTQRPGGGKVWQIDIGTTTKKKPFTFADITVSATTVSFKMYRGDSGNFSLQDSLDVTF